MNNKFITHAAYAAALALLCWLSMRYLLSWILPILLAFLLASLLEPLTCQVAGKLRIGRAFAAFLTTLSVLAALIMIAVFGAGFIIYEAGALIKKLPAYMTPLLDIFREIEESIYRGISSAPIEISEFLFSSLESLYEQSSQLPSFLYSRFFNTLSSVVRTAPEIVFFLFTFALGSFFISAGYPQIRSFITRQIPEKKREWLLRLKSGLSDTLGLWFRAQLILFCVSFAELSAAFLIIRTQSAIFLAFLIALADALPVFGTGIVLIPWALTCLVTGDTERAICLIATFVIAALVRSVLEAKLLGAGSGVHPAATLLAIYLGFKTCGIAGMVFFPILLMLLKQFNDRGYISLWKSSAHLP